VRILVVVASTQAGTLRAEVGKGSMRTAVGHGLVGPKWSGDAVPRVRDCAGEEKINKGGQLSLLVFFSQYQTRGFPPGSIGREGELYGLSP